MIRVLLADIDVSVRRGLRALLATQDGLDVCAETDDARAAVSLAREHKPHVAVIDTRLPPLNGSEVIGRILGVSPSTSALIYTMTDSEDVIAEALRAGARGYLSKAETESEILSAVEALASGRTYIHGLAAQVLLDHAKSCAGVSHNPLTRRESEVVHLIAEGQASKEIASTLGISLKTVETHRALAMRKVNATNAAGLVRYALRSRLAQA